MYLTHSDPISERRRRDYPAYTARYARLNGPSNIDGLPRWAVESRNGLMPLQMGMLNSVVRITSHGDLLGTGSLVAVPSETIPGKRWPYVVTADHVVKNQTGIEVEVPDPTTFGVLYEPVQVETFGQPLPKVDLSIAQFPETKGRQWQASRLDMDVLWPDIPLSLGGPLHYLGIFEPVKRAMARTGAIATVKVPIVKPEPPKQPVYEYEAALLDCRSYAGFSGSPCFVTQTITMLDEPLPRPPEVPTRPDGSDPELRAHGHYALMAGIFTAHYTDEGDEETNPAALISRYGVGIMLNIDYLWKALMTPEARLERQAWDAEHLAAQAAAGPPLVDAGAKAAESQSEWDRFEALTRKLVQTPKPPQ
jgi:hypothetical protein